MAYLKQNVNFIITGFLILAILVILVASVFFHLILNNLSNKYEDASSKIEDINTTLTQEQIRFQDTSEELQLRSERETHLSTEFSKIEGENKGLLESKENLQSQLGAARNDLAKADREVVSLRNDIQIMNKDLNDARAALFTLTASLQTCNTAKNSCQSSLNTCEDDLDACEAATP